MTTLARTQDAMQAWLLRGEPGIASLVRGDRDSHRLRIYADAYRLRLLDVLDNDFPATKGVLGDDAFESLALAYVDAHPSTHPSVRHFGRAFADWLATRTPAHPGAHELARFEWLQGECFDADDAPSLGVDAIATLPAQAWPTLRLRLHPAIRLLSTQRLQPRDGRPLPSAHATHAEWLLWRADLDVHWRTLDADEAEVLHALRDGVVFAELCERLALHHHDAGALRAAALLKRWLADGLLVATHVPA